MPAPSARISPSPGLAPEDRCNASGPELLDHSKSILAMGDKREAATFLTMNLVDAVSDMRGHT